jgi:hypothetical protein
MLKRSSIEDLLIKAPDGDQLGAAIDERLRELDTIVLRAPFTMEIARAALMRVVGGSPRPRGGGLHAHLYTKEQGTK